MFWCCKHNVLMKEVLTFCCQWGQSCSPLCSPVGWPGTAGTCCHPQSVSYYMISLFHSSHPASRASWKRSGEQPHRARDGHTSFLSILTGQEQPRKYLSIYNLYTLRGCLSLFLYAGCVQVLTFATRRCLSSTLLGEWGRNMQADHLSWQVQALESIEQGSSFILQYADWMGTAEQWMLSD